MPTYQPARDEYKNTVTATKAGWETPLLAELDVYETQMSGTTNIIEGDGGSFVSS